MPSKLDAQTARLERLLAHTSTCETCKAREAFISERLPPMPRQPLYGWRAIAFPLLEAVNTLPNWAQPIAFGALGFLAYSLVKLILFIPAIIRSPAAGIWTAIQGLALSASIGAVLGMLYSVYREIRSRWFSRRPA
jgi:hypothetical protein